MGAIRTGASRSARRPLRRVIKGDSPQAVIKFMEDKEDYSATSSEMHNNLKVVAAQLGVDVDRDKAWPKSARWLWRRIKEVAPLLVGVGIEASRERDEAGTTIALRRVPT